jgi:hypothetical protein
MCIRDALPAMPLASLGKLSEEIQQQYPNSPELWPTETLFLGSWPFIDRP